MRGLEALGIALALGGFAGAICGLAAIAILAALGAALVLAICWKAGRWQALPLLLSSLCVLAASLVPAAALALLAVAGLVGAFGLALLAFMPIPRLPLPSGPHKVGLRIEDLDCERRLQIHLFYPAAEAAGKARRFHTQREATAIAKGLKAAGAPGFLHSNFRLVTSHSHDNAKPAIGRFPLVLFNHGGGMFPSQNLSLMQELASRGMVCASIGRAESLGLAWGDGSESVLVADTIEAIRGSDTFQLAVQDYVTRAHEAGSDARYAALREASGNRLTALCDQWHLDTMQVIDALRLGELATIIDFDRRAYLGMSLGGAVSMQAAMRDKEARACVNLDGMNWALPVDGETVPAPCLQFYSDPNLMRAAARDPDGGKLENIEVNADTRLYNDRFLRSDAQRIVLSGIGHMGLTDMALGVRGGFGRLLGLGRAASPQSVRQMNARVVGFLADQLAG